MKRFNARALAAIVALSALMSCDKEDKKGIDPGGEFSRVKFQLSYGQGTRAEADLVAHDELLVLQAGHIFFTEANGKIGLHVGIVETAGSGPGAKQVVLSEVKNGEAVIEDVPVSVKKCYILSNDALAKIGGTGGITGNLTGQNISAVQAMTAVVPDLNTASGDVSSVPLFGVGNIAPGSGTTAGNKPYDASVNVQINALASRIQIKKLSGVVYDYKDASNADQTITIDEFTVEGIYINNYYPSMTVNSTWPQAIVNNGQTVANYASTGSTTYASTGSGYKLSDNPALASTNKIAAPAGGKVWAYNVFPTPAATVASVPHIVIKLSQVKFTDSAVTGQQTVQNQFLSIASIKKQGTSPAQVIDSFAANNIYTFDDIRFDYTKLSPVPETDKLDVWVTVQMMKWQNNAVDWNN